MKLMCALALLCCLSVIAGAQEGIRIHPQQFEVSLREDESKVDSLTIINQSTSELSFAIRSEASDALVQLQQGNAEYHWRSSLDPNGPIFRWEDISSTGTDLGVYGDDGVFGPFDLGFSFSFYGDDYDQFYVSTNGFITFLDPWGSSWPPDYIPDPYEPNAQLSIMGADLIAGSVLFASDGQKAVISFYDSYYWGDYSETNYTFQIILHRSGRIVYQYLQIKEPYEQYAYPIIGIENAAGDDGIMIDPYEFYPNDSSAIEFYRGANWLTISDPSVTVPENDSTRVHLTFDATDIPGGTYHADLFITDIQSNQDVARVPITLDVTAQPDIEIDPDLLDFGLVYNSFTKSLPVVVRNYGSADLQVSSISSSSSLFSPSLTSLSVAPHDTAVFFVSFAPLTTGEYNDSLQLTCNDWDESKCILRLSGISTLAPDIDVQPKSFSVGLDEGAKETVILTLKNESEGILNYALLFRTQTGESTPLSIAQILQNNRRADYRNKQAAASRQDNSSLKSGSANAGMPTRPDRKIDIWKKYQRSCFSSEESIRVVVVQGPGTDDYSITEVWYHLNQDWSNYGTTPIGIDYSTLNKDDISLADIMNSDADVIVLSDVKYSGWYGNYALTTSECQAIVEYVNRGNGLYCSGETLNNSIDQEMQVHVDYLAPLLGLDPSLVYEYWYSYEAHELLQADLNHPLWRNFYTPYHFDEYRNSLVPLTANADWHEAVIDAEIHAISADNQLVVTGMGNRLSVSALPETDYYYMREEDYQFLYNAMMFAATGGLVWCTTENRIDSLMGNSEVSIPLVFDATNIDQGEYVGVLVIRSNDPDEAEIEIDLSLSVTDKTAPAVISDLGADYLAPTFITFSWTTPGDNGMVGRAERFDVRYSTEPLDESTWDSAEEVDDPVPSPLAPGTTQRMTVTNLQPQLLYYIAIKVVDEADNASALSNVVSFQTPAGIDAIIYIPFEEGSGDVAKNSGQAAGQHDGTLFNFDDLSGPDVMENSGWTEHGCDGGGLMLDGQDDYVQIADYVGSPLLLNSALKISFAFKLAEMYRAAGQMDIDYILRKNNYYNNGYYVAMNHENGKMRFAMQFPNDEIEIFETTKAYWEADMWHIIMITYDYNAEGDNVKLYVNGKLDAFYTTKSVLPASNDNVMLGDYYYSFTFTIDNLLIHNTLAPMQGEFAAYFKATPKICTIGDIVQFTDRSTGNITSWRWDFGDSTYSDKQNPQHIYAVADTFTVSLTVNGESGRDTKVFEDMIFVFEPLQALFTAETTSGELPLKVKFTDKSVGFITAWKWDFGDGATSAEQNPSHEYTIKKDYTITLTVYGIGGAHSSVEQNFIHADVDLYDDAIPQDFILCQNYPNPFNPTTTIRYGLPYMSKIEIDVIDVNGKLVQNLVKEEQEAGYYSVVWDAEAKSSNIYFIRMKTDETIKTVKCVLLK
ncbi:PKD domain-containing protein [candidate division KSB1 bacterium]|nr:PKD domain-containing protein [candidate division KSB1 bacterium]